MQTVELLKDSSELFKDAYISQLLNHPYIDDDVSIFIKDNNISYKNYKYCDGYFEKLQKLAYKIHGEILRRNNNCDKELNQIILIHYKKIIEPQFLLINTNIDEESLKREKWKEKDKASKNIIFLDIIIYNICKKVNSVKIFSHKNS